jgi:hypothetical protein
MGVPWRWTVSSSLATWWIGLRPYLLSVLRIVSAFLFVQFGTAKLFALPGSIMPDGGTAAVSSLPWIAGTLETVGGLPAPGTGTKEKMEKLLGEREPLLPAELESV